MDDASERIDAMREAIEKHLPEVGVVFFDNAPDMIDWLEDSLASVSLLCLDHDLGPNRERDGAVFDPGTGRDVVDSLAVVTASCPVLIHSSNGPAANGMRFALEDAGWQVERVVPFDAMGWISEAWSSQVRDMLRPSADG
jgi:hypothetical protein